LVSLIFLFKKQQWITQEIELSVSIAEAKLNLTKLIEERKESALELAKCEEKLALDAGGSNDEDAAECDEGPPACKRRYLHCDGGDNSQDDEQENAGKSGRARLAARIARIKEDIECKSIQINDIQQMILEGDQDDKTKHMFNNVHGLLEAKVLLKHLYSSGVQYLLDSKLKQIQFENNSNSNKIDKFIHIYNQACFNRVYR
jgi:hypothetical protein